jgi:hypothetical protein
MLRSTLKALLEQSASFERRAQEHTPTSQSSPAPKEDHAATLASVLAPLGYGLTGSEGVQPLPAEGYVDVQVLAGGKAKWKNKPDQMRQIKSVLDPICMQLFGLPSKPVIST